MSKERKVLQVVDGYPKQVGDGFEIHSPMPSARIRQVSPFLLLDHAGPTDYAPGQQQKGVDERPHRGFETVTIVYQGRLEHRDSAGNYGKIIPGGIQWMTAVSSVVHEEKHEKEFSKKGGTLEMIQLWVNLPAKYKMSEPKYQDITPEKVKEIEVDHSLVRIIAGSYNEAEGPATTYTPLDLFDIRMSANKTLKLPVKTGYNLGMYVVKGSINVGNKTIGEAQMAVFDWDGQYVTVEAQEDTMLLFLSGVPINEPVANYGPFILNNPDELKQAIEDYQSGKMGSLAAPV